MLNKKSKNSNAAKVAIEVSKLKAECDRLLALQGIRYRQSAALMLLAGIELFALTSLGIIGSVLTLITTVTGAGLLADGMRRRSRVEGNNERIIELMVVVLQSGASLDVVSEAAGITREGLDEYLRALPFWAKHKGYQLFFEKSK